MISPDGHTLAVTGALQTTRLWDIHDPAHPALIAALTDAGSPVAFTADSHAVAVIDPTGAVVPRVINLHDAATEAYVAVSGRQCGPPAQCRHLGAVLS